MGNASSAPAAKGETNTPSVPFDELGNFERHEFTYYV
jgi:hypothetical protein